MPPDLFGKGIIPIRNREYLFSLPQIDFVHAG